MTFARYAISEEIHRGLNTFVFKARDRLTGSTVALKVLEYQKDSKALDQFRQEYLSMAVCRHPSLVPVLDYGLDEPVKKAFYIMPWIEHEKAIESIDSAESLFNLAAQIAQTLVYLHRMRMHWQKFNGSHIFWLKNPDENGLQVKIINYGISSKLSEDMASIKIKQHLDLNHLAETIDCIVKRLLKESIDSGGTRPDFKQLIKIRNLLNKTIAEPGHNQQYSAWDIVMMILRTFDDRSYAKRPARRINFSEAPFIGFSPYLNRLDRWFHSKHGKSVLFLTSMGWMGRYRLLRNWLPGIRTRGHTVIECNNNLTRILLKFMLDGPAKNKSINDSFNWVSRTKNVIVVLHRDSIDALRTCQWNDLKIAVERLGWKVIISLDDFNSLEYDVHAITKRSEAANLWISEVSYTESCQILSVLLETSNLPRHLEHEVHRVARGNPGLIVKVLNYWIAEDLLIKDNKRWILKQQNSPLPIPPDVQSRFKMRVQHLYNPFKKYLELFSLVTSPLTESELSLFLEDRNIGEDVKLLMQYDIIDCVDRNDPAKGYQFSHPIYRIEILSKLTPEETRQHHLRIASVFKDSQGNMEEMATHWLKGGEIQEGVRSCLVIASKYRQDGRIQSAQRWLETIQRYLNKVSPELQGEAYSLHAEIALILHRNTDVLDYCERALQLIPAQPKYFEIRSFLYQYRGQVFMRENRYKDAEIAIQMGLQELNDTQEETSVTLRILAAANYRHQLRYKLVKAELEKAKSAAETITDPQSKASAHATILNMESTVLMDNGDLREACNVLDEGIKVSDECNFSFYRALLRNKRAKIEESQGYFATADRILAETYRICRESGVESEFASALRTSGNIAMYRGQYSDAEAFYLKSLKISRRLNSANGVQYSKFLLARVDRLRGELIKADTIMQDIFQQKESEIETPAGIPVIVELGMINLTQAQYTQALRYFYRACRVSQKLDGHHDEAAARYGLALCYWRLNHLNRMSRNLDKAKELVEKSNNRVLSGWISLLEARLKRLDRDRIGFKTALDNAERLFSSIGSEPGLLSTQELRIRDRIDRDLSDQVWSDGVKLWDRVVKLGSLRQIIEVAVTVSRLGVRRSTCNQIQSILDAAIGLTREKNCREDLWRLLRVRAQAQDEQGFTASTRESLVSALNVVDRIVQDVKSPILRRGYRKRYDIMDIRSRALILSRQKSKFLLNQLPGLGRDQQQTSKHFIFTSEHNRLIRDAVRKFRKHKNKEDLISDLVDYSLKLSGADRIVVFLKESDSDGFQLFTSRRMGLAPGIDDKVIRTSALFEKVVSEKINFHSSNVAGDRRIHNLNLSRAVGERALLLTPMRAARDVIGVLYFDTRKDNDRLMKNNAPLLQELADEAALSLENLILYRDLDETFMSMVRALGTAVDAKDPYTHGHASRVAGYALLIGHEMELEPLELRDLEIGAYLHDLGKIGISGGILKSRDALTDDEMSAIRHHPEIGTRILSPVRKLSKVSQAIRQHHERYDGKGYPDQLKGDEILLMARIIAVADALDAMTTRRPYQEPLSISQAIESIYRLSGSQFDPDVTAILKDLYQRGAVKLAQ